MFNVSTPDRPSLSIAAVVSLCAGLLGCLIVTAPIAIVAGVIGILQTRDPNVRGRKMAIAGMALGMALAIISSIAIYSAYSFGTRQVETLTPAVINAAVTNDLEEAAKHSMMTPQQLADLRDQVLGWGKVTRILDAGWTGRKIDGHPDRFVLTGTAVFDRAGKKPFLVVLEAKGDEVKVVDVTFKPPDAAAPAAGSQPSRSGPATQALER